MNFLKFFPVPKYLQIFPASVDVSDQSIKYLEFKICDNKIRLNKFGERKIEEGIIDGGVIKNKESLTAHLRALKKEIGNNYIVASLPEEKAFLRIVRLPAMEKDQIEKSLELQLEELIPLPPGEASFDSELIQENADVNTTQVLLTAFPRSLIDDYAASFIEAGFSPVGFEVENQAISRAIVPSAEKEAVIVVDFGKTRTSFLISDAGVVKFTSTIPIAGNSIDKALSRALNKSTAEAEKIKKNQIALIKKTPGDVSSAIFPIVAAIKDEIRRTVTYWNSHAEEHGSKNQEIKKIIFCGGDANLAGLTDYFSCELQKPVELGNPWVNVFSLDDYVPEMEKRDSLAYATVIGLSMNYFK